MIKVTNEVEVFEFEDINNPEAEADDDMHIYVKSHWNESDKVVIVIDNKEYTVIAKDLLAAINNSVNSNSL